MYSFEDFTDRVAVIVGGSSGIGAGVARDLLFHGARVIITSRNPSAHSGISELERAGAQIVAADMTSVEGLEAVASATQHVDHLVLAAADLQYKRFRDFPADDARETVEGKLLGYWNVVHKLLPLLDQASGSIVLVSGFAAWRPVVGASAVATANAGLVGLGRSLALELAPVRVNVLSPGTFDTPAREWMEAEERKKYYANVAASLPAGRVGLPEHAAQAVRFLLSNPYVTGTVLHVDGGLSLV